MTPQLTRPSDVPIPIPVNVARCPICKAPLNVGEIAEWECDGGKITDFSIDCTTEPDIDGDEWPEWHAEHYHMPYVDWLPLEVPVGRWLNANHRIQTEPPS